MDPREYRKKDLQDELEVIKMLESSGGKNINHQPVEEGPQKGETAIGQYGLMPDTIRETATRYDINPELIEKNNDQLKQIVNSDPQLEQQIAGSLMDHIRNQKKADEEQAAYMWLHGHNKDPNRIPASVIEQSERVKKFRIFKKKQDKDGK